MISETINWLMLTVPFIAAGAAFSGLQVRSWPKVLAAIVALTILAVVFASYNLLYRSIGFPQWMRWFANTVQAEPLPGRPEVDINTKLDANWTVVGMNYEWMVLVAKTHIQVGKLPEIYMRWEHATPQPTDGGKFYLSEVQWVELDCKAGRWNPLVITSYAANNLSGGEVYSGRGDRNNPLWNTPEPQSIGGAALRKGCQLFAK